MYESILVTIKKMLGLDANYDAFDIDVIADINAMFLHLNQLGIGPKTVYSINGVSETWKDFLGNQIVEFQAVKTYIYLNVRLLFDPPSSGVLHEAMERLIKELEWRLNVQYEDRKEGDANDSGDELLPET